jgi:predicted ATPase
VGCSLSALQKIEAGDRRPSKQLAELLAKSLEIPIEHQATFIKIARGEMNIGRLTSPGISHVADDSIFQRTSTARINLPFQPTPLIGREAEISAMKNLLSDPNCRLLTLTGLGGIGKTRLAIEAASACQELFPEGVVFVALAAMTSPAFLVSAIADASGFKFVGSEEPKEQLLNALGNKRLLLVLDNAEYLGDEVELITQMLQNAPLLRILITSRERLSLQSEWIFNVEGLPVPPDDQDEHAEHYSSVALFIQRARQARSSFHLGREERPWVIRICRLADGMPLGIELAAAWVSMLTCQEIAQEIENNLDFLSATMRDLPERQRSMRVVLDYSWQMLSKDEQQVLAKLSVFRGGFQRSAVEQVADAALSNLSRLVERNLLRLDSGGRYDLHELVRQYSASRLGADPRMHAETYRRHYAFYFELAESAEVGLRGSDQLAWLQRLEADHDNLRAALKWALEYEGSSPGEVEFALRLSGALRWFWRMRGYFHEGRNWLIGSLQREPVRQTAGRAASLLGLGLLMSGLGDIGAARSPAEESVVIYRTLVDQKGLAEALTVLGYTLVWQGEANRGHACLEEALSLCRTAGDPWGEAHALFRLGSSLADYSGDINGLSMLEESGAILEDLGEKYLFTSVLTTLGIVSMGFGDYPAARSHLEQSLIVAREIGHPWGMANALTNLGCVFRIQGEYVQSHSYLEEAQRVYQGQGQSIWETDVICALAENDIAQGDLACARLRLQLASSLIESTENKWLHALVWYFRGLLAYYEGHARSAAALL